MRVKCLAHEDQGNKRIKEIIGQNLTSYLLQFTEASLPAAAPVKANSHQELNLKCHYDENRIFSTKAIFKHKQIACMRRKMPFTIFKYLFFVPEILKFLKYAN